ncbi:MAG: AAA family ATPase [Burkholderiales bacterium]|nr:AAA family ATPase [Burkholderiales bacterium]
MKGKLSISHNPSAESKAVPTFDRPLPLLPLRESDFSVLRKKGEVYVDKTEMVFELAHPRSKLFLARPEGFGKSLLLSTFASLFKYGLKDFSGLAIEKLWKDKGEYLVMELDFSQIRAFKSVHDFRGQFNSYLLERLRSSGLVEYGFAPNANGISEFSKWLDKQPINSVVLLVDNYDGPITSGFTDTDVLEEIRSVHATFYSCLKGASGCFRFLFLTGTTKLKNAGMFPELNALRDITSSPRFGTIVGYTSDEVTNYFGHHIQYASNILGISKSELIRQLIESCGGYCFEETGRKKVLSCKSILKFLMEPKRDFQNF